MGRYCSYLLPKQGGGTSQIQVNKTQSTRTWDALYCIAVKYHNTTEQFPRCLDDYVLDQFIEGLRDQTAADVLSALPDLDLKKALDYFSPEESMEDGGIFKSPKKPASRDDFQARDTQVSSVTLSSQKDSATESYTVSLMCDDCDFDTASPEVLEEHVRMAHGPVSAKSSTTRREGGWDTGDAEIFKSPKRSQSKCFFRQTKPHSGEFRIETKDVKSDVKDGRSYNVFGSFACKPCGYKTMSKEDFVSHNRAIHDGIAIVDKISGECKGNNEQSPSF